MAIRISGGLQGPQDMQVGAGGGTLLGGSGGGQAAPYKPIDTRDAFGLNGFEQAWQRYAETHDKVTGTDFILRAEKEMAANYDDPETGQFATRRGAAAKGMTEEFRKWATKNWSEDAHKQLTAKQRKQVSQAMGNLYLDRMHRVAAHEAEGAYQDSIQRSEIHRNEFMQMGIRGEMNTETLKQATDGMKDAYDNLARLEGWSPEFREMRQQQDIDKMITDSALLYAEKNPYGSLQKVRGMKGEMTEAGFAVVETKIREEIERQVLAREREQSRFSSAQRNQVEKNLYSMAHDGQLTRDAVEAARDILSPSEYNKFLNLSDGKSTLPDKSDPEALIALQRMAVNGDSYLQGTADNYLREGKITSGDYSKMLNEGQQWRKPVMQMVDQTLKLKTGYSDMNPTPDAGNSYLMARNDFMEWLDSDAGKQANDDARLRMADMIGNNYRIIQSESLLSIPAPLFLIGTRTNPDIPRSVEATMSAHKRGEISDVQRDESLGRLKRMSDIIARQSEETGNPRGRR